MRHLIPLSLSFRSVSCSSSAQEQPVPVPVPDTISVRKITLLFAGDLMQHQAQVDTARITKGHDYTDHFKLVKKEISKVDIAIDNLEVTPGGKPYRGYPAFSAPGEYLSAIEDADFDVLIAASNYCLNRDKKRLERTILMLDSLQAPYTGTYIDNTARASHYPPLLEQNDLRITLPNYTYDTDDIKVSYPNIVNYIDKAVMMRGIGATRALHLNVLIACMYWGIEYQSLPNRKQAFLADWLPSQGVTHTISSHPYTVQPMELWTDILTGWRNVTLYFLGNFIPSTSVHKTDGGLPFKLKLMKDSTGVSISNCGYGLIWTACPIPSKEKNCVLYPTGIPTDFLSAEERNRLKIFTNDARELFRKHNRRVNEYIF